jgi:hypothetical protein
MEQRNKRLTAVMGTFFLALILFVAGCASGPLSTREKGVLAGGGLGAATGAIIGSAVGAPGAGAEQKKKEKKKKKIQPKK